MESPEIFVAMSHESLLKYIDDIQENATLIIDPDLVYEEEINDIVKSKNLKVYKSQATRTAEKVIGRKIVANIVMLGSFVKATGVISQDAAKQAILSSVPKGTEDMNMKAFEEGMNTVKIE